MNKEKKEELLSVIQSAANFLRGTSCDPRIPKDARTEMSERAIKLDIVVENNVNAMDEICDICDQSCDIYGVFHGANACKGCYDEWHSKANNDDEE